MSNTHESYITRNTAKKLQSLGFNWECRTYYSQDSNDLQVYKLNDSQDFDVIRRKFNALVAPTQDVVRRWLREVKNTEIMCYYDTKLGCYSANVLVSKKIYKRLFTGDHYNGENDCKFETYELAIEAAINKCLDTLEELKRMKENGIQVNKCPKNELVTFYYPDGTEIVKTDNDLMFNYIRSEIKNKGFEGCYLVMQKGLRKVQIDRYGNLEDWPDDLFSANLNLIENILGDVKKEPDMKYNKNLHKITFDDLTFF